MANKKQNKNKDKKDKSNIRQIRVDLTVENKAFLQLVCTSKNIDHHTYINQLIKEKIDKSDTSVADTLTNLDKL